MDESVKVCVEARTNFFSQYYSVSESMQPEVNGFISQLNQLGENCADSVEFESRFASEGFSEKFNSLIMRCTPVPYKMSKEEKQASRQVVKEMIRENKGQIAKDIVEDVADSVYMKMESDVIAANRKNMIENGTFDEYTKLTNAMEDAEIATGFFGKLFKRK